MTEAYFVCHISPTFQVFFDSCLHWVSVVCAFKVIEAIRSVKIPSNECCLNINLSSEDLINIVEMHLEDIQVIQE
jgi:hypothetical protein